MNRTPIRILLAEDSENDEKLVRLELARAGFEVTLRRVETAEQMREALESETFDIVLSDYSMPAFSAPQALEVLAASNASDMPLILVSGSIGERAAVDALKAGAADFVQKDNLARLAPAIRRELREAVVRRERREALDALRAALAARDEFLAIAAHELRTPIAAMLLHVDSMLILTEPGAELDRERIQKKVQALLKTTNRLHELVDRMLQVGRIHSGRFEIERGTVDLRTILVDVVDRLDAPLRDSKSTLRLDADSVVGFWDRDRLDIAVSNLLANALKYGRGQEIAISLRTEGDDAVLTITDGGIGIAEEDQHRIFGRFERAVPQRNYGGLGVGLWLTKQIVDAHGGHIEVVSRPGMGATFRMVVPCGETSGRMASTPPER